ncbi:hypothetical protein PR048_025642 [Dryococelus australis]|uniref:Endonuclease/exonuclease/phosphatase domain-containing protein n=1 Tax=Dryococelus australis TaxID=614101 RepID=A0ABQ9GRZ3_9NEOP|nr:hypothetical protein PR048_025642 [Dryococelus australis]
MYWNENGICTQMYELEQLIETYGLDILLIYETGLKTQHRLHVFNYETYINNRIGTLKGEMAIIVKRTFQHHRKTLPSLDHIEATAISVRTGGTDIVFIAAYKSPPNLTTNEDLGKLTEHQSYFFLAGNLNSKHTDWNCRQTNRVGQNLKTHVENNNYMLIAPTKPTFYSNRHNRGIPVYDWWANKTILTDILPDPKPYSTTADIGATIKIFTDTISETIRKTNTLHNHPLFQGFKHLPEIDILIIHKRESRCAYQWTHTQANRAEYHRAKAKMRLS